MSMIQRVAALAVAWFALLTVGCGDSGVGPEEPGPVGPVPVAQVTVTPAALQLVPGDTVRLDAVARAADGTPLPGRAVTWHSTRPEVAAVSPGGLVTAHAAGTGVIRAAVNGVSAQVAVEVLALNPAPSVSAVTPDTVETGTPVVVLAIHGEGFAASADILWDGAFRPAVYVGPTEVRLVLGPGDLQEAGHHTIAVRNPSPGGGTSSAAPVVIVPGVAQVVVTPAQLTLSVGRSAALAARALDAHGRPIEGRTFSWTSSNQGAVSVSAEGVVTARSVGPALITVTTGSRSAQVSVEAVAPVQFVWVTPNPAAVLVESSAQLTARTFAAGTVEVFGRAVTWTSEDPAIATVDATGRVTGVTKGRTYLRAESEGVVGRVQLDVRQWGPGPVSTLALRGFVETLVWPDVGTTTWVDGAGTAHTATQTLWGGTLTIDASTGRWTRTWDLRVYVGVTHVGQDTWTEAGTWGYRMDGSGLLLTPDGGGPPLAALLGEPGELQVRQVLGTAPLLTYRWIVE